MSDKISPLFSHQKEAVATLKSWEKTSHQGIKGGILAFKMGLGKTRTMLELVNDYKINNEKNQAPTLIVCTKSNICIWEAEIKRFYKDKLKCFTLYPDNIKMPQEIIKKYDIVITTYEIVKKHFKVAQPYCFVTDQNDDGTYYTENQCKKQNLKKYDVIKTNIVETYTPIYSTKWLRIISDESHKFANVTSQLYYSMVSLKANSYFCMSGTPIVNYSLDLYSLFKFVNFDQLKKKEWKEEKYEELQLSSRILVKDYEDTNIVLPQLNNNSVLVSLNEIEIQMYQRITDKLRDAFTAFKTGQGDYAAPLAMFTRLRQLCVSQNLLSSAADSLFEGHPSLIEYAKNKKNIEKSSKIIKCLEIVKDILNNKKEKVIIFSSFVSLFETIGPLFDSLNIKFYQLDGSVDIEDRKRMCYKFNNSETVNVFLLTYKVGGVGLNLTGANNVILFEPWWNNATEEQAIFRCYRIGQTKDVNVHSLLIHPSFEEHLLKIQLAKNEVIHGFINNYKPSHERSIVTDLMKHIVNNKHY